ncbi:unnamed protein product [Amaranthus hypochondriacus]
MGSSFGHRGEPRHRWWRGPREPSPHGLGASSKKLVTLFVDGISSTITLQNLRELFEKHGKVMDVYISGKKRKLVKESFGFVRYSTEKEAQEAMKKLDDFVVHGVKLKVSKAKYKKGGVPAEILHERTQKQPPLKKGVLNPALRDQRSYRDIVKGTIARNQAEEVLEHENTPTQVIVTLNKSTTMEDRLKFAIIVEVEKPYDSASIETIVKEAQLPVVCISSLSPYKLMVFMKDLVGVENAIKVDSPLMKNFEKVYKWSDDLCVKERVVWVEYVGMHPKCWSFNNFEQIGEKSGTVIRMEDQYEGVHSLTCARLLIRTTFMRTIDEHVAVNWEEGSVHVWVREFYGLDYAITQEESDEEGSLDLDTQDVDHENTATIGKNSEYEDLEELGNNGVQHIMQSQNIERVHDGLVEDYTVVDEHRGDERHTAQLVVDAIEAMDDMRVLTVVGNNERKRAKEPTDTPASREEGTCDLLTYEYDQQQLIRLTGTASSVEKIACDPLICDTTCCVNDVELNGEANNKNQQQTTELHGTLPVWEKNFSDPLIWESGENRGVVEVENRFEPIANLEILANSSIVLHTVNEGNRHSLRMNPSMDATSNKRPSGRPKKISKTLTDGSMSCPPTSSMDSEIEHTWHTVKRLGVTSSDDGVVFSKLRRSKRILNAEQTPL